MSEWRDKVKMKTNITISTGFVHRVYCVVKMFHPIFDAIPTKNSGNTWLVLRRRDKGVANSEGDFDFEGIT